MATGCRATNQAGQPCAAAVWQDGWCRWHSPALEHERREWSRRGGRGKSNKARAKKASAGMEMSDVQALLAIVLKGTISGRFTPGQASACTAVARALVTIHENVEIEARLEALERAAGTPPKGWTA